MKSIYILVLITSILISCSCKQNVDIDKIVDEIKSNKGLTEVITKTQCNEVKFKLDVDDIRCFEVSSYMGDGGEELECYFYDNKLIYCDYNSFYDGPMQNEDGTYTSGGEAIGSKYKFYYENEKLTKVIKDGKVIDKLNPKEPDYHPDAQVLVGFAKKVVKIINTTDSELLCDGFFYSEE